MILVISLAACWIDWTDLDGDAPPASCYGGAAPVTWFRDADDDGYGNDAEPFIACDPPNGYAAAGGDCDETDPSVSPAAPEKCNGMDDDCDFQVDEDGDTFCVDVDHDGHGDASEVIHACEVPVGYAPTCDDCDDAAATTHPGASEIPDDGVDNDCDTLVDEG
jgi:hypothetical protein